ncbi:hypothetical protein PAXINDRAFT_101742 [Paxillus involutus ATCC 200175]|uniref:Uncharacterized protein n=1 Tax=Paxillus involutus ATCC 200175 TaxID=664439 RepID=A0A0C9TKL3_PAXIN|nr:hypothetical protein PAXINDRAFT_101742 [Paxillus involutus ATCC 200175]
MTVPIPIYRENPDNYEWEVASVYGSDDCESLGRSQYDGSVHSGSVDVPALRLQLVLRDESHHRVGYHSPQQHHQDYSPSLQATYQWDARFAPGSPGGFCIPPAGTILPPSGSAMSSSERAFPIRERHIPSGTGRVTPDSEVGLFDPSPLPLPLPLASPPPPPRSPSPLMPRPSPALVIPQAPPPYSHSGTGSRHTSPIVPSLYREYPIPPHPAEAGYQTPAAASPSRRSPRDTGSSYSGKAPLQRGQASEDLAADVRRGRVGAPNGGQHYFPREGPRGRVDRSKTLPDYDLGVGAGVGEGGMRMARPQQREPSVWRRFVRRFSPSRGSIGPS